MLNDQILKIFSSYKYLYKHEDSFISVFRFVFCLGFCIPILKQSRPVGTFNAIDFLKLIPLEIKTDGQFNCVKYLLILLLILSAIGFLTRLSLLLSSFFYLVLISNIYSYLYSPTNGYMPSDFNLAFYVLLILAFAPKISLLSIDRKYIFTTENHALDKSVYTLWPRQLIILLLGLVYISSFVTKMRLGAWTFLNGYNLSIYFGEYGIYRRSELLIWLSNQANLCHFLTVSTMLFELSAIVFFFVKNLRWLFILSGLVFHYCTLELFSIDFFYKYLWIYLVFIDWDKIYNYFVRKKIAKSY